MSERMKDLRLEDLGVKDEDDVVVISPMAEGQVMFLDSYEAEKLRDWLTEWLET